MRELRGILEEAGKEAERRAEPDKIKALLAGRHKMARPSPRSIRCGRGFNAFQDVRHPVAAGLRAAGSRHRRPDKGAVGMAGRLAILVAIGSYLGMLSWGARANTWSTGLWFSFGGYEGVFWTIFTARTVLSRRLAVSTGAFWLSGASAPASPATGGRRQRAAFSAGASQSPMKSSVRVAHVSGRL